MDVAISNALAEVLRFFVLLTFLKSIVIAQNFELKINMDVDF